MSLRPAGTHGQRLLVVGGARSGKSSWAQTYAERLAPERTYIATARPRDEEMAARVARHQQERGPGWTTLEEPLDLAPLLARPGVLLVDCLTLWLSNVLEHRSERARQELDGLVAAVAEAPGPLLLVINEVGQGIVPMHPLARRFRDESGRLVQRLADVVDEVVYCVAGRALRMPGGPLRDVAFGTGAAAAGAPARAAPRTHGERAMTWTSIALPRCDEASAAHCQALLDGKTKPPGSLGQLEATAVRLAGIVARPRPTLRRPTVVVAGADHGVVAQGVSAFPREVTGQMLANFAAGGAAINVLAQHAGAELVVVDAGSHAGGPWPGVLDRRFGPGTADFTEGPAMPRSVASAAVDAGVALAAELVDGGAELLALGEMGIGNTTAASALTAAWLRLAPEAVVGRGTGVGDEGLQRKRECVRRGLTLHGGGDPLGVLSGLGGFEIALLAGVALGAAERRVPVLLDGFISTAAGLAAERLVPGARFAMLASHVGVEPGHRLQLEALDLQPLLALGLRLGEGSGAALALPLLQASLAVLHRMSTFAEAGVSDGA